MTRTMAGDRNDNTEMVCVGPTQLYRDEDHYDLLGNKGQVVSRMLRRDLVQIVPAPGCSVARLLGDGAAAGGGGAQADHRVEASSWRAFGGKPLTRVVHRAADWGRDAALAALLSHGADVDLQDEVRSWRGMEGEGVL